MWETKLDKAPNRTARDILDVSRDNIDNIQKTQLILYVHSPRMEDVRSPKKILEWITSKKYNYKGVTEEIVKQGGLSDDGHCIDWRVNLKWRNNDFINIPLLRR